MKKLTVIITGMRPGVKARKSRDGGDIYFITLEGTANGKVYPFEILGDSDSVVNDSILEGLKGEEFEIEFDTQYLRWRQVRTESTSNSTTEQLLF